MRDVALISHSPAQCPSADRDTFELFATAIAHMEEVGNEMGVADIQFHALLPGLNGVIVMDAPDYKTVCGFLMELRIDTFNDISLYESVRRRKRWPSAKGASLEADDSGRWARASTADRGHGRALSLG